MRDVPEAPTINEEQVLYAKILEIGMYLGLGLLLTTFALYVFGIVEPAIPVEKLCEYWTLSAHEYLEITNNLHVHHEHIVTGWSWLSVLDRGDYLNFLGIALLSSVTIFCFLGIIPTLLRKNDKVYAAMALSEAIILALAASGLLSVGH